MCLSDTFCIRASPSRRNMHGDRGPISDLSHFLITLFAQVVVQLTAWNTWLLTLSLFANGLSDLRWRKQILRRTPSGFQSPIHITKSHFKIGRMSVFAWGKTNMHSKYMCFVRVSELISLQNEVSVRTRLQEVGWCIDSCWWWLYDSVSARKTVTCENFTDIKSRKQN